MSDDQDTLCFACGLPVGDPPALNHLSNGQVCPTCRDRVLESLPCALPAPEPLEVEWDEDALASAEETDGYDGDELEDWSEGA